MRWVPLYHCHKCPQCCQVFSCSCLDDEAFWGDCAHCQHNDPMLILTETDQEFLKEAGILL